MSTQASVIIDAAVKSSLLNDAQRTSVARDTAELLAVLTREVQALYALAGTPPDRGGMSRGDLLATSTTLTLNAATPPSVPTAAFRPMWSDATGASVAVVTRRDLLDGRAELPPAIVIEQHKVRTAGRSGDPVEGAVLTLRYVPLPAVLTATTHYLGAVADPTLSTDSYWPDHVANPWLIATLRKYLAVKRGIPTEDAEMQDIVQAVQQSAGLLANYLGLNASDLVSVADA